MSELLLEIRTGGYPPAEVASATRQLKDALVRGLRECGMAPMQSAVGFTNRRMMVLLRGLPAPPRDAAQQIACDAARQIATLIERCVAEVEWRRSASWSPQGASWVRPVTGVLALFEGQVVATRVAGVAATDSTVGHPTLSPRKFRVEDGDDYGGKLVARGIEVRHSERLLVLRRWIEDAAGSLAGTVLPDPELLEWIACSSESPGIVAGTLPAEALQLPKDLIVAGLRRSLGAFVVERDGELVPAFIGWMDRPDDPQGRVRRGQELAAAACLQNLRFLFERDQSEPVAVLGRRMEEQEWRPGLGTYGDKTARLRRLGEAFCRDLGWEREADHVAEACGLLYADRHSRVVRELPELRGVVGGLLAFKEGFAESVWRAIYEHHVAAGAIPAQATAASGTAVPATSGAVVPATSGAVVPATSGAVVPPISGAVVPAIPRAVPMSSPSPELGSPTGRVGRVVALAERVDTLVGRLSGPEGEPSAASDGSAAAANQLLARGVVRLLIDGDLKLDVDLVLARSVRAFATLDIDSEAQLPLARRLIDQQLRVLLHSSGYLGREIAAVLTADGSWSLPNVVERLEGIRSLRESPEIRPVAQCARRLVDILRESPEAELDVGLLVSPEEKDLYILYQKLRRPLEGALASGHYREWLQMLASLSSSVDRFLRQVLVRDEVESVRQNRLALVQAVHRLCSGQVRLAELASDDPESGEAGRPTQL